MCVQCPNKKIGEEPRLVASKETPKAHKTNSESSVSITAGSRDTHSTGDKGEIS